MECNPLFGPIVFDTAAKILAGEKLPKKIINKDEVDPDASNASALLPTRTNIEPGPTTGS